MRYYIIFGCTLLISLVIIFYPQKYLAKYEDYVTIDYSKIENTDSDLWTYEIGNDCLKLEEFNDKLWKFKANKDGKISISFYYDKNEEGQKYKIDYKFKVKNNKITWLEGSAKGLLDFPNPY